MSSNDQVKADERFEAHAAITTGAIVNDRTDSHSSHDDTNTLNESVRGGDRARGSEPNGSTIEDGRQEDPARDLEQLATVSTNGPAYTVFSSRQVWFIIGMASWAGFFSPVSGNIYFPALNTLARDLDVSSTLINLTLTSYMIFQGLAPTIFGDLGDMAGRRPAYFLAFVIYIGANVGLALQNNYAALFVLRCLQSSGSSGTIALANGVASDVATSAQRGSYMGIVTAGAMVGPSM